MAAVVIGVDVGEEREPGGRPYLHEGQGRGQQRERREQDRTTRRFVGLGAPYLHYSGKFPWALRDQGAQRRRARRGTQEVTGRPEEKVGLALGWREALQERQHEAVFGDALFWRTTVYGRARLAARQYDGGAPVG